MLWSQEFFHYFFIIAVQEFCYNLWNLLLMWLFLLTNMMTTTDNNSGNAADNTDNNDNVSTTNLNTHVNLTDNNSCDYFLFDMCSLSNYMNNQIIYYFISDTISAVKQACFQ